MAVSIDDVSCGYGGVPVLTCITIDIPTGTTMAILGPNGVGKTTLFKTILGLIAPLGGSIAVDGATTTSLSRRALARLIGYVPQSGNETFGYRTRDVVLLGRTAWLGMRGSPTATDRAITDDAMARMAIEDLADVSFGELSGGQRQMVLIARALAQQPAILMMDEPTANLDLGNEARVLRTISELSADGMTVIFTSHRPDHAFVCADNAVLIAANKHYHCGPVEEVLTAATMKAAYGVDVHIATAAVPGHGTMTHCIPLIQ